MKEWLKGIDPIVLRRWVSVGVAGVILILIANVIFSPPAAPTAAPTGGKTMPSAPASSADALIAFQNTLDQELSAALGSIAGAGDVRVTVMLSGSPARRYVENTSSQDQTTTQTDAQGGTQKQTSTQSTTSLAQSGSSPVLAQEVGPDVVGILIVATGARDPVVRADLFEAASTLLGIPAYKVEVEQ